MVAIRWLMEHHRAPCEIALETGFYGALDPGERDLVDELRGEDRGWVEINAMEWLVAEGRLVLGRGRRAPRTTAAELVLGPGGPQLSPEQRRALAELAAAELRLYAVRKVMPRAGVVLGDVLAPGRRARRVEEPDLADEFEVGDVVGARLLRAAGGAWRTSPAFYSLTDEMRDGLIEAIGRTGATGSAGIVAAWLFDVLADLLPDPTPRLPRIVDRSSGEPILLVTDHYTVRDWDALAAALAAQPDVDGDRADGWTRFEPLPSGLRRVLLSIDPSARHADRLTAFTGTLRRADEGRAWLQDVAGDALRHLTRDVSDPRSPAARTEARGERRSVTGPRRGSVAAPSERGAIPPEEMTEIVGRVYREIYAGWPDERIPVLGNRTPRQVAARKQGCSRVVTLVHTYERGERERARAEGREPADLGFLWERLGMKRGPLPEEEP